MDFELARYANRLGAGVIDPLTNAVCDLSVLLALWAVLLIVALRRDPSRRYPILLALGVAIAAHLLVNEAALKHLLLEFRPIRIRPYLAHPGEIVPVGYPFKDSSFPSSHAASIAAFATIFGYYYRWTIPFGLLFVLLMAFCRVHNGMHYPTDVAIGSLLGFAYGALGIYGSSMHMRRREQLKITNRKSQDAPG